VNGRAVIDRYESEFGNLDEIAMPQVVADPKFTALLERALARGVAVSDEDLRTTWPDEDWEGVR
jgi:hypothetical protein